MDDKDGTAERERRTKVNAARWGQMVPAGMEPTESDAPEQDVADARVQLYDLPIAAEVDLNARTEQALTVWFDGLDGQLAQPGGDGAADPRGLNPITTTLETTRLVLGFCAPTAVMVFVIGLMTGWSDGLLTVILPLAVFGAVGSFAAGSAAKKLRADHQRRIETLDGQARRRMRAVKGQAGAPAELKLTLHVAQLAHEIESSPAFSSDYLAAHRRRINLGEEVQQLTRDAADLWNERRTVTPREDVAVEESAALMAVLDRQEADLIAVWDGLMTRAHALEGYLQKIREMEPRLTYLEQLESASQRSDRIADLKLRTIDHRQAADGIDQMAAELSAVREAIDNLVRGLDREATIFEARPESGPALPGESAPQ